MKRYAKLLAIAAVLLIAGATITGVMLLRGGWSDDERASLLEMWIGNLPPVPADPSNKVADDARAVKLGHKLFFDNRFSSNAAVSCSSCHVPGRNFNDNLPLGKGVGTTTRKTMTVVGTSYTPWLFWDGRKDSQWAQALGPLESAVEHGGTRAQYAHLIDRYYREEYEALFGPMPDISDPARFPPTAGPVEDPAAAAAWKGMTDADRDTITQIYVNMGKAIAAYERKLVPGPSRFDSFVEALTRNDDAAMRKLLSPSEESGLRLFIGKAQCINCHNGPLVMGTAFHNTGVPAAQDLPTDDGRISGVRKVLADEFNCLSEWSDAKPEECVELRFVAREGEQLEGAFRPPSLRNITQMAPYMHAGQFATLTDVLNHYNQAKPGPVGHSEIHPLGLSTGEMNDIIAFLGALSSPIAAPPELLQPPAELQASR